MNNSNDVLRMLLLTFGPINPVVDAINTPMIVKNTWTPDDNKRHKNTELQGSLKTSFEINFHPEFV